MNLAPSAEQAMLREMVRRFLDDRFDAATMAKGPMAPDDWRALGDLGLFAFLLPERAAGMGGGAADIMIVAEELGRSLAITPLAESLLLCAGLIARHGTPAQIGRWVAPVAQGSGLLAFARGGTLSQGLLSGAFGLVRDGMAASAFVIAVSDGQLAVVPADADGVVRAPVRLVDGSEAAHLRIDNAACEIIELPPASLAEAVDNAELAIIAEMVGAMATLLDLTVDYVKQRKQFGTAIGSFQVIQHRCARLYTLVEQSRSMMIRAALAEESDRGRATLEAKAYIADAALRLAEEAVQFHGGMGVTDELAVGRGLRRVLLLTRLSGGGAAARAKIAA